MFTIEDAAAALAAIDIDISNGAVRLEDLHVGMNVELEHGTKFPDLDVTGDDPVVTLKMHWRIFASFPTTTTDSKSWNVKLTPLGKASTGSE